MIVTEKAKKATIPVDRIYKGAAEDDQSVTEQMIYEEPVRSLANLNAASWIE